MTPVYNECLIGGTAGTLFSRPVNLTGLGANASFEVIVQTTALDLVAEVVFGLGNELPDAAVITNAMTLLTVAQPGIAFVANPAAGTGHIRIGQTLLTAPRTSAVVRITGYGNWVTPSFIYTSGGNADTRVRVIIWGAITGQG